MEKANPFIYGKPVPVDRHVNRNDALRTIFSRIKNKESTAIVGDPQIGKTSLINYILSETTLNEWLKQESKVLIPVEIDVYAGWLSVEKNPIEFWKFIFSTIESRLEEGGLKDSIKSVKANQFGSATLVSYFKLLGKSGRRVLLVIDEFDSLLHHPKFSNAEFFGCLRSIATNTDGLQLITSSITTVEEMDEYAYKINPFGSPFFNNFTNVRLELFDEKSINELIESSLEPTGINFNNIDREFVIQVSGHHPYRLQAACASLFDGIVTNKDSEQKFVYASDKFLNQTKHHFELIWRRLDDKSRTVLVIMTTLRLGGLIFGKDYSFGEIEKSTIFEPELQRLSRLGLVEKVGKKSLIQWDSENLLVWRDQKWRIACEGIVWWLTESIVGESRDIPNYEQWLHDHEVLGYLLTRKQWENIKTIAKKLPTKLGGGISLIFIEFIKGLLKKSNLSPKK